MVLIAVAMALVLESPAYPIPPQPLRSIYRAADLVVVAKPGQTVEMDERENVWENAKVVLTITRTLKGKSEGNEITVIYSPGMICPAPDRYPQGKTVLAFLCWNAKSKAYNSVALSYGTKILDEVGLKTYLQLLEELEKIPAEKKFDEPSDETIEWLVRCIEQPWTRWEGAYEFCQPTIRIVKSRDEKQPEPIPLTRIKNDQWKRIVAAFVQSKEFHGGESAVLSMVYPLPDPRIDEFLVQELKRRATDGDPDWCDRIMKAIVDRLDFKKGQATLQRYESLEYSNNLGKLRLMKEFLELLEKK